MKVQKLTDILIGTNVHVAIAKGDRFTWSTIYDGWPNYGDEIPMKVLRMNVRCFTVDSYCCRLTIYVE